ncbi:MAG TPA: ribbon-helix-helix protein, CopG family [Chthoniobacterales bacterium]
MRTTLSLDDDVFEAVQSLARSTGKNLGQVVSRLIRQALQRRAAATRKNGLPVFQVDADAPIIPGDRAQKLLAEDRL